MNFITWRYIFNSYLLDKTITEDYSKCRSIAKSVNYEYFIFKAYVYSVDDLNMNNPICTVNDIK